MMKYEITKHLKDLREGTERMISREPNNDDLIDKYEALDEAIDIIKGDKSVKWLFMGIAIGYLIWVLSYFLFHL